METSIAFRAAVITLILASPFLGCFAATFVRADLASEDWLPGRSDCQACRRKLSWHELIPVLSWLLSRGACRSCETRIPLIYPSFELAFLAAALWASWMDEAELVIPGMLLGWHLILLFAFDILAFVLPNFLTYGLLVGGLAIAFTVTPEAAFESAAGALAGALSLLLVKCAYRLIAKRDGLGMGDVKLFAAAGAWVGISGLPQTLLIGAVLGLIYAAIYGRGPAESIALKKVPLGAGLCVGLWFTWMLGSVVA